MLNTKRMEKSRESLRKMVIISMLSAISIFLGLSGLGFIPLPLFKITIMHIPVIIGAIVEGPIVGATIGLIFGLFSLYQNLTAPTIMSPFFYNPIVSIVPRVLIGIVAYYIYSFLKNKLKNQKLSIGIAAVCGSLTNTIGVLGFIYLIYFQNYAKMLLEKGLIDSLSFNEVTLGVLSIILTNGIPEAIICGIAAIPVVLGIIKMQGKN